MEKIYHIGICDDQEYWQDKIFTSCVSALSTLKKHAKYFLFTSGEALLENSVPLDILLLDEEMPALSGLNIKNIFENQNRNTIILFITSHDEIIYDAFGKNVLGFLHKPIEPEALLQLLDKVIKLLEHTVFVTFPDAANGMRKVSAEQILYIKADGNYCHVVQSDTSFIVRKSISDLTDSLPQKFFVRIHKSYIVNMSFICKIEKDSIFLHDNKNIPIARRRRQAILDSYSRFMQEGNFYL